MKPRIGIYGLTSCAGDQLVLLNCEDELLDIVSAVDLRSFVMAQSHPEESELDVAFVEGAVAQPRDQQQLLDIRRRSALVVAIGTCAVWGGIPASKGDPERVRPEPLSKHIKVDLAITGCPIEKEWLLRSLASLLHGDTPLAPKQPVCADCKMNENACLMRQEGRMCLGPVTVGGCRARCPGLHRPCLGCRGPVEDLNSPAQWQLLLEKGFDPKDVLNRLGTFAGTALTSATKSDKEGAA